VHVFMVITPKDAKVTRTFLNLREGERQSFTLGEEAAPSSLEVVKIHPGRDAVDVVLAGTPMLLTLKSNSFLAAAPPKGGGREKAPPGGMRMERRFGGPPAPGASPGFRQRGPQPFGAPTSSTATGSGGGSSGVYVGGASTLSPQASTSSGTYVGGASTSLASAGGSSGAYVGGASPQISGGGSAYVGGGLQLAQNPGGTVDLNPSVPARTAQSQVNWPPVVPAPTVEQAASLVVQEAAGGPPAPPGIAPGEPTQPEVPPVPVGRRP